METSDLLKPGRPVYVKTRDEIGEVIEFVDVFDMWRVETLSTVGTYRTDELEPLFTLNQVVNVKVEEETTPALINAVIPFGMSSDELAEAAAQYIAECVGRIKGVGKDQYSSGTHQKFETMDLDELFEYALEELQDISNYAVFLAIRLERIRHALNERDDLGVGTEEDFAQTNYSVEDFEEEN